MQAVIRLSLTPAGGLYLRCVQLLLAVAVLAVSATMIGELVPGSAIQRATLTTGSAAGVQVMWTFPLAVLNAMAVLGKRRPHRRRVATYLAIAGDFLVGLGTFGAVSASLGLADCAVTLENAEWPRSARYMFRRVRRAIHNFSGRRAPRRAWTMGLI